MYLHAFEGHDKPRVKFVKNPIPDVHPEWAFAQSQYRHRKEFFFFEDLNGDLNVSMKKSTFDSISERLWGMPSAVYEGKYWRNKVDLVWLDVSKTDPSKLSFNYAKIVIKK